MNDQRERFERMKQMEGAALDFLVQRETVQEGRTFSPEAMDALGQDMMAWVGTRLMRRWEHTKEPPTHLRVTVTVEVA